jgi:hypothetical protein
LSALEAPLTGLRYLAVVLAQLVAGFATAMLGLYVFLLVVGGPLLLFGYFSSVVPSLLSGDSFVAGFAIVFGMSPILIVGFQLARHAYSTREWMKSTRSAFSLGLFLGVSVVGLYILMLSISIADPGLFGPGAATYNCIMATWCN